MAIQTIFESNQPALASLALANSSIQEVMPEEGPLLGWYCELTFFEVCNRAFSVPQIRSWDSISSQRLAT